MIKQRVIPIADYKLKIIDIIDETHDTKTFRLERLPEVDFLPGQFFMVRFPDNKVFKRAYSIASSPTDRDFLDITMNLVGEFTKKLWQYKTGDELVFTGPYGKFFFNEEVKQNLVLIGGGLGITPLRSIIRYCTDKNLPNKINLLYSVRTPEDIVYRQELEKFKEKNLNYDFLFTITRPKPEHNWGGGVGRIDKELLKQNISDIGNTLFFICGPLQFVKDIIAMLKELGAAKEQIRTDIWGE